MKKKERMYYYNLFLCGKTLNKMTKSSMKGYPIFLEAPSKKAIEEAGVKKIKGRCANNASLDSMSFGKKYSFCAGDPIEFIGTPTAVVYLWGRKYLKITIGDDQEVTVYSLIDEVNNFYFRVEVIEEIKT
jgi:hypothetical protein